MPTVATQGRGKPAYRLMVEGWPEMFRSDSRITASTILDGRTILSGLTVGGLEISERLILSEARTEPSGMRFRIRPSYGTRNTDGSFDDPITESLSQYPDPVAQLEASLDEDDTTIDLVGGGALTSDVHYHIGTEVILVTGETTIERTKWDTQPQTHRTNVRDESKAVFIFTRPPTMEGRRFVLYRYEPDSAGEDLTGAGTAIWRGVVSRQPRLDADGLTWIIDGLPITHVLKQTVSSGPEETRVTSIYHHRMAPFSFRMYYDGEWSDSIIHTTGAHTEEGLIDEVNTKLSAERVASGADASIDSITLELDSVTGSWRIHIDTGTVAADFKMLCGSVNCGFMYTSFKLIEDFTDINDLDVIRDGQDIERVPLGDDLDYFIPLTFSDRFFRVPVSQIYTYASHAGGGHVSPLGDPTPLLAGFRIAGITFFPGYFDQHFQDPTSSSPTNRLHINDDFSTVEAVHIPGTGGSSDNSTNNDTDYFYEVGGSGTATIDTGGSTGTAFLINLEPFTTLPGRIAPNFAGWVTADTPIIPTVLYAPSGTVVDFFDAVISQAVNANDGDTPWVTAHDTDGFQFSDLITFVPENTERRYQFARQKSLEEILSPELLFVGHCMRLDSSGKLAIFALPGFTETEVVADSHEITGAHIVTPAGGYGAWPTVEPQRDGTVNTILVQQRYNPTEDEWTDVPVTYRDPNAIARNKTRGKQQLEIKLYSTYTGGEIDEESMRDALSRIVSLLSRDYIVLQVPVTFEKFDVLCGDVVTFTWPKLPNGSGGRGFDERRAMVVERRWPLDPQAGAHGWLTLWTSARPLYGYAPAAVITAQSNTVSNKWALTCSVANTTNVNISTNGDGECLEHFVDGDYIAIVERDDTTPTVVTGRISGTPNAAAGTCTVNLDGVWVPGVLTWSLEFQQGSNQQTGQTKFAYVADNNQRLVDDSFARQFL